MEINRAKQEFWDQSSTRVKQISEELEKKIQALETEGWIKRHPQETRGEEHTGQEGLEEAEGEFRTRQEKFSIAHYALGIGTTPDQRGLHGIAADT